MVRKYHLQLSVLSNDNVIAFSEMVPVLHIVGVPSTTQQKNKPILHHTLGDGRLVFSSLSFFRPIYILPRYDAYLKAASQFTIFNAEIKDKPSAAQLIDQAITTCITRVRYFSLKLHWLYRHLGSPGLPYASHRSGPRGGVF